MAGMTARWMSVPRGLYVLLLKLTVGMELEGVERVWGEDEGSTVDRGKWEMEGGAVDSLAGMEDSGERFRGLLG